MNNLKNKKISDYNRQENKITIIDYCGKHFDEKTVDNIMDCSKYKDTKTVTWINIDNIPPANFLKDISLGFDLHPIVIDNILNVNQRPKLEVLDDYIYISLKMLSCDINKKKHTTEQMSMVVGSKFLITFQQGVDGDPFGNLRNRIRNEKSRMRNLGTDYLAYTIFDAIIDEYFKVLEIYGDKLETLNIEIVERPSRRVLRKIDEIRREIINLRKIIWPLREIISNLERIETPVMKKNSRIYWRDIYDHVAQIIDSIETYRDMLGSMMDIYLSSLSNKTNEVMKVLTIITTFFMPLSFLTGLYGMNFKYMPFLDYYYGFGLMIGFMYTVVVVMLFIFRRRKWF